MQDYNQLLGKHRARERDTIEEKHSLIPNAPQRTHLPDAGVNPQLGNSLLCTSLPTAAPHLLEHKLTTSDKSQQLQLLHPQENLPCLCSRDCVFKPEDVRNEAGISD